MDPLKGGTQLSLGGFSGVPQRTLVPPTSERRVTHSPQCAVQPPCIGRRRAEEQHLAETVRIHSTPMGGWEREKAKRVVVAFDRILQRGWFDEAEEEDLAPHEMVHVNAVREHYAMRRDRLQTPTWTPGKSGNTMGQLDWSENTRAIDVLGRDTGVQDAFLALAERQRAERLQRQSQGKREKGTE